MSIREFLESFAASVSTDAFNSIVQDAQRRAWVADGVAQVNHNHSIPNSAALVDITAEEELVYFPRNYKLAEEAALLAVEYGYSAQYAADNCFAFDFIKSVSSPIFSARRLSINAETPAPRVTKEMLYGVRRPALRLHKVFPIDRTEVLIYNALYEISDRSQELIFLDNPADEDEITISAASEIVYQFLMTLDPDAENAANQVKIGSTKSHTAKNFAAVIENHKEDEDVAATAVGEKVILSGFENDIDFVVTFNNSSFSLEYFEAVNNLTDKFQASLVRWVEAREFDFLATYTGVQLSDTLRQIYLNKAKTAREEVLDSLVAL
jgi:hypothetical protein